MTGLTKRQRQQINRQKRIGQRVRELREQRKVRQVDLAAAAGLSWRHLIRIEQGAGGEPKTATLDSLASALGVSRETLDDDDEEGDRAMREAFGLFVDLMRRIPRGEEAHR